MGKELPECVNDLRQLHSEFTLSKRGQNLPAEPLPAGDCIPPGTLSRAGKGAFERSFEPPLTGTRPAEKAPANGSVSAKECSLAGVDLRFRVLGRIDPDCLGQLRWLRQPFHKAFRVFLIG
jgi:hypothetical protein